jgi:Putative glycerate kinase
MRSDALTIFSEAVQSVQPHYLMPKYVTRTTAGLQLGDAVFRHDAFRNLFVVGAGKASAAMAVELERLLGARITDGVVVTKYDHALPLQHIRCREAGHPVPDEAGLQAGEEMVAMLKKAGEKDLVIALISGGASALMVDCPPGATLQDIRNLFKELLACGANIEEMNIVRKHLSPGIKGGQLAKIAYPATLVSFILSDVPGDALESIASGPTVADPSTFADAWNIVQRYGLHTKLAAPVLQWLQQGLLQQIADTPKPGDAIFEHTINFLIGTNRIALQAAKEAAEKLHYHTTIVSSGLAGEAREQAVQIAEQLLSYKGPRPACLLWGGETTVTLKGKGKGGRNQELALAALQYLAGKNLSREAFPVLLSAGTDGTDGPTDAAGGIIDYDVYQAAIAEQLNMHEFLVNNDAYHFLQQTNGHVITGPTQTNVMDIIVGLLP